MGDLINSIFGGNSKAAAKAARQQADAITASSAAQVAQLNQQAQGAALAQQTSINQATLAAQLRDRHQQATATPAVRIEGSPAPVADPRRKYRATGHFNVGGGASGNGMGIRI